MKVLLINSVCGRQSTGRIVSDIQEELIKSGHECIIAYGEENSLKTEGNYHIGTEFDRYIHAGVSRLFDTHGLASRKATKKLIAFIKEYDPDVINLHNIHGYYINIEVLFNFLRTCGKKIIWTLHDCWAFTGHCTHFTMIGCEKWKNQCFSCAQKKRYPSSYLKDNSQSNYIKKKLLFTNIPNMTLITPSKWLAGLVKQSFLKDYSVFVINNGINLDDFKPTYGEFRSKFGLLNKKIVLGVASVWDERKGLDDFCKLAEMLDNSYRIVLVGLTEKQKRSLSDRIIGITRTNSTKELAEIYTAADVFVNPTYEDNYPTTNLEAQACGTPVITYMTGGSPESVTEQNGWVVEQGDIVRVSQIIKNEKIKSFNIDVVQLDKQTCTAKYIKLI